MNANLDIRAMSYSRRIKILSFLLLGLFLPFLCSIATYVVGSLVNMFEPNFVKELEFTSVSMFLFLFLFFNLLDKKSKMKNYLCAALLHKFGVRPTAREKIHFFQEREKEIKAELEFLNKKEQYLTETKKELYEELENIKI